LVKASSRSFAVKIERIAIVPEEIEEQAEEEDEEEERADPESRR
jgi:hypothetical protein